jgi:hypothetical protein
MKNSTERFRQIEIEGNSIYSFGVTPYHRQWPFSFSHELHRLHEFFENNLYNTKVEPYGQRQRVAFVWFVLIGF